MGMSIEEVLNILESLKRDVIGFEFKTTDMSTEHYYKKIWKEKFIGIIQEKINAIKENKDGKID